MPDKDQLLSILDRPGSISFSNNIDELSRLKDEWPMLKKETVETADYWFLNDRPSVANTRVKVYPTGHIVFYNKEGKRILFTDPQGNSLHECEWGKRPETGKTELALARMQLDCRQWVGIKPRTKVFPIDIDVKGQPNWEKITLDDLRKGAAQAWKAPLSEVKYFYRDECFNSHGDGKYHIEIKKDGLYSLHEGAFDKTLFISFMFAINWANIDLIPVVELFQSTLPGTGGAVFEMIWGLYDDQSRENPLPPLRYRGLPTYPSPEAFKIFSAFFTPTGPKGEKIIEVFMDTNRSYEITWEPKTNPPWRYFSNEHSACLTVQDHFLYKVTNWNDPAGIPFINCSRGAHASCDRRLKVKENGIALIDNGNTFKMISLNPEWNIEPDSEAEKSLPSYPFTWEKFFNGSLPEVDPVKILYTVSFYPEGGTEIEESSLQPLVLDQIIHYMEQNAKIGERLAQISRVLIHTFDSVIAGCIDCSQIREYTVLFSNPEFACKNAQLLWNHAVSKKQLAALENVSFLSEEEHVDSAYQKKYDMIFKWIPFMFYQDQANCQEMLMATVNALEPGGTLFLAGPKPISGFFNYFALDCEQSDSVMDMPFFQQHLKMCPENLINQDLTVFLTKKRRD